MRFLGFWAFLGAAPLFGAPPLMVQPEVTVAECLLILTELGVPHSGNVPGYSSVAQLDRLTDRVYAGDRDAEIDLAARIQALAWPGLYRNVEKNPHDLLDALNRLVNSIIVSVKNSPRGYRSTLALINVAKTRAISDLVRVTEQTAYKALPKNLQNRPENIPPQLDPDALKVLNQQERAFFDLRVAGLSREEIAGSLNYSQAWLTHLRRQSIRKIQNWYRAQSPLDL